MISDVLYEAVEDIKRYCKDIPSAYSDKQLSMKLDELIEHMEAIRIELDTCPPMRARQIKKTESQVNQPVHGYDYELYNGACGYAVEMFESATLQLLNLGLSSSDIQTILEDITNETDDELCNDCQAREAAEKAGNDTYLCRCECGKELVIAGDELRSGNVRSCPDCQAA